MSVSPTFLPIALLGALLAAAPAGAADACKAEVHPTARPDLVTDEAVTKVFAVEVRTEEACAEVAVDLTVTERLFNGEEITTTVRGRRKVDNHTVAYRVNHRIARDSTLVDWKFTVARCEVCR